MPKTIHFSLPVTKRSWQDSLKKLVVANKMLYDTRVWFGNKAKAIDVKIYMAKDGWDVFNEKQLYAISGRLLENSYQIIFRRQFKKAEGN